MKKTDAAFSLTLALVMLLASCGDTAPKNDVTADMTSDPNAPEAAYRYPDLDLNGETFTFLNYDDFYSSNSHIDFDTQSGDYLEDAIYARNRKVEEKLNCKIRENKVAFPGWNDLPLNINTIRSCVMAGDSSYDAAYLHLSFQPSAFTENIFYDLNALPNVHLDKEYWDRTINKSLELNGKLFAASSPINLITFDMSWGLIFNQNLLDDIKMEYPYQLVRDGKWTLDRMAEYSKAVINLNGDESFNAKADGNAVYGIARHYDSIQGFIYSANNHLAKIEGNKFVFNFETERLYTTLDKVAAMFNVSDGNGTADSNTYYDVFKNDRTLFITSSLLGSLRLRSMNSTFGLLPLPKFDEKQEDYYTYLNHTTSFLTVPSNVRDPGAIGAVLDSMSYESSENIISIYYDITVSQKGLRNEDSIDMLDIIRSTRGAEFSQIFGITTELQDKLRNMVNNGDASSAASTIAENKEMVMNNADKLVEALK